MAIPQIPKALITGGNSASEKAILSVIEAQVRGILTNENATLYFKTSAVADQINVLNGVGMAIYRIAERITWGDDYDPTTGMTKQWRTAKTTTVILDQKLTIDWAVEDFDMERFLAADPSVRATLLAEWSSSMIMGYLFVMEAIFLQGIKDYCIAKEQVLAIDLLNLDPDKAVEAFYSIGNKNNSLLKKITMTEIGVNLTDIRGCVGLDSYLQLTKVFQKLNYGQIAADTIVTGKLYKDSAFGTDLVQSFYLEQLFTHGTETGLHLQKTFDLQKLLGVFTHKNAVAMPSSFQTIRQLIDPNTGNLKWIGKELHSVPTAIRGNLMYVIMPTAPTSEEIEAAQDREWSKVGDDKSKATFKLADFDSFPEKKKIEINNSKWEINGTEPVSRKITNYNELVNVEVKPLWDGYFTVKLSDDGTITITGIKNGSSSIEIKAKNAIKSVIIEVIITEIIPQLSSVITQPELGEFNGTTDLPNWTLVESQVINKNPKYKQYDANISVIDASKSSANGTKGKYKGIVKLTYTYTKK